MTAAPVPAPNPARGRPRDPQRRQAILRATLELLAELGYDRMSVEAIAARAGVSKPTVYRRWPGGKLELVADAMRSHKEAAPPVVDTGSLRGDLLSLITQMTTGLSEDVQLASGVLMRLRENAELAELVRDELVAEGRSRFQAPLDRAVARGELPADAVVPALFHDVAPSLAFMRMAMTGEQLGPEFAAALVDDVLLPILHIDPRGKSNHVAS